MAIGERLRAGVERLSASPRVGWYAAVAALALTLPTVLQGLQVDDYWHAIYLERLPRWASIVERSPLGLFTFFDGDPARTRWLVNEGVAAWWTEPSIRIAFMRPLSALTHYADHRLWPESPALMHLQSVAWYVALALAVAAFYRGALDARSKHASWAGGLATLLYAIDHTHGQVTAWVANRNALVAACFAVLALVAYARGRDAGGPRARWAWNALSAAVLAVALAAGETALGALGYLAAHAAFLDRAPRRSRVVALLPHAAVLAAWAIAYRSGGYGVFGSGMYRDPIASPIAFARAAVEHAPLLLGAELGSPSPDIYPFLATSGHAAFQIAAVAIIALAALALVPFFATDERVRYLVTGALIAIVPGCATAPAARLLLLPGLGLLGVVAILVVAVLERAPAALSRSGRVRRSAAALAIIAGGGHAFLSPILIHVGTHQMVLFQGALDRFAESVPGGPELERQKLVVVNAPDGAFTGYASVMRTIRGEPAPRSMLCLAVGTRDVDLERADDRTLVVRSRGGFYRDSTDLLTRRPESPMPLGTRVALARVRIQITRTDRLGVPIEARFQFDAPLESEAFRFVRWRDRGFEPYSPPRVGDRAHIAAQARALW